MCEFLLSSWWPSYCHQFFCLVALILPGCTTKICSSCYKYPFQSCLQAFFPILVTEYALYVHHKLAMNSLSFLELWMSVLILMQPSLYGWVMSIAPVSAITMSLLYYRSKIEGIKRTAFNSSDPLQAPIMCPWFFFLLCCLSSLPCSWRLYLYSIHSFSWCQCSSWLHQILVESWCTSRKVWCSH